MSPGRVAHVAVLSPQQSKERLLKADLNLDQRRAVTSDRREHVIEQISRVDGGDTNAEELDLGGGPRRVEISPVREQPDGAPDHLDRRARVVDGGRERPRGDLRQDEKAEPRVVIEGPLRADAEGFRNRIADCLDLGSGDQRHRPRRIGEDAGQRHDNDLALSLRRALLEGLAVDVLNIPDLGAKTGQAMVVVVDEGSDGGLELALWGEKANCSKGFKRDVDIRDLVSLNNPRRTI